MEIERLFSARTKNKLTITAHKAAVRMKFAIGNTDEENAKIDQLFLVIAATAPEYDFTLRGNMNTKSLLESSRFVLRTDNRRAVFYVQIYPELLD